MYSLNINFLNDRPDYKPVSTGPARPRGGYVVPTHGIKYLMGGTAVAFFLVSLVGGWWFIINNQISKQQAEGTDLDNTLNGLGSKVKKVQDIQAETVQIDTQTQFFASIFNTSVKPLSAFLQELRDRVPAGVQIDKISQKLEKAPPDDIKSNVPWSVVKQKVEITGYARTFDQVNDFMLAIKRSAFFKPTEIKLVEAKLTEENPTQLCQKSEAKAANTDADCEKPENLKLPEVVKYKIQASLSNVPASEILADLERTKDVGLTTRIKTLQQQGVIKP